jgi:hypothetical protein
MSKEERIAALLKAVQEIPDVTECDSQERYYLERYTIKPLRDQARELQLDLNL